MSGTVMIFTHIQFRALLLNEIGDGPPDADQEYSVEMSINGGQSGNHKMLKNLRLFI